MGYFSFFSQKPDCIYLVNICTKEEGLKRHRCSIFAVELIVDFWWIMRERGASLCARYNPLIVTDEHQILGDCCRNVFRLVRKKKNMFSSSMALPNTGSERSWPKLFRKPGDGPFSSPQWIFFPFLFRRPDRIYLMNICAKEEGLERPRCSIFVVIVDFW